MKKDLYVPCRSYRKICTCIKRRCSVRQLDVHSCSVRVCWGKSGRGSRRLGNRSPCMRAFLDLFAYIYFTVKIPIYIVYVHVYLKLLSIQY